MRALHEATCVDLKNSCRRIVELKRKADDAHDRTGVSQGTMSTSTKERMKSEAAVNHNLLCLGLLVKYTANATHALTC